MNRPDRPTTIPGNIGWPGGSGNRPDWNRPDWNRPDWNRPNWDRPNWNRPDWGWGNNDWHDHWHDHCIHPHYHRWYHGCWPAYWGSYWYAPLAWGAVGWGLGSWINEVGYPAAYYNPYYVVSQPTYVPVYDYAQPVVVNNYIPVETTAGVASNPIEAPAAQAALSEVDQGLAAFKAGNYGQALDYFNRALKSNPGDPIIHEVRALTLFALGQYTDAAATLNSLLAAAPGMDWTTLSSLYGDPNAYTPQLRKLEQYCKDHPKDAGAYFVLAYHYLVLGDKANATAMLRVVVQQQPKDVTAKRMLSALAPEEATDAPAAVAQAPNSAPPSSSVEPSASGTATATASDVQVDLVGTWIAKADNSTIQLTVTEDSAFTWVAKEQDKVLAELKGELVASEDGVSLNSDKAGSIAGSVTTLTPDQWRFQLAGAPVSDQGLEFSRQVN